MTSRVTVVGSGPAGLSASLYLSAKGAEVTVIDRLSEAGYERYHSVCGAGISKRTFRELELIEESHVINPVKDALLRFPGGTDIRMRIDGAVIDRVGFLKDLRERCSEQGCRFVHGRAVKAERTDDGFKVTLADGSVIESDHLVGCDGAFSVVRRDIFGTRPRYELSAREFVTSDKVDDTFEMILGGDYVGAYRWVFPSGDGCNTGSVSGRYEPEEYIQSGGRVIPAGGVPKIEDSGAYLCGDAAGMPNPVSFGGLRAALLSGQECARSILTGKTGSYERWWRGNIMSSERFCRFHDAFVEMSDEQLAKMAKPVGRFRSIWMSGILASLRHPKYIPLYIGCLVTFRNGW